MGRPEGGAPPDAGVHPERDPQVHVERPLSLLGQGKTLRIPMGYLYIASGLVLLLLVVAYMVGYRIAEQRVREDYANLPIIQKGDSPPIDDPLSEQQARAGSSDSSLRSAEGFPGGNPGGGEQAGNQAPIETNAIEPNQNPASGTPFGPIDSDPRREGFFYFVLMETTIDGALRLARFCREKGLEAYVIASHNARNRRVIVLPGLTSRSSSDPAYRRLREEIRTVGQTWQNENPRESDLSDAYPIPAGG